MWACGQSKLVDHIRTHQVIAAPSINDDTCSAVLDDEENLEQVMSLHHLGLLDLCAKHTLHNNIHVARGISASKDEVTAGGSDILLLILHIGGAHVTAIICRHICPPTWAIFLHMAKTMAAVALNPCSASRRSNRGGTTSRYLHRIFT